MSWLYCDFHIHTTWSDGALDPLEVVDLYGEAGFDAIAITDHAPDRQSFLDYGGGLGVSADRFDEYLAALREAARYGEERWGMLVVPGIELSNNLAKYHIICLDVREYIDPDLPVEQIIEAIRAQDGVSIACHPRPRSHCGESLSEHLWEHHERYGELFDAWEVANRDDLFNVVGLKKFSYIANSDFHERRHIFSWKTLLRSGRDVGEVKKAIRQNSSVSLFLYRGGSLK